MSISTTQGRLYLANYENPSDALEIQFVPKEISMTNGGDSETVSIIGRNFPFYQYSNGERTLKFDIEFYSDTDTRDDVMQKIRKLEGWAMNETFEKGKTILLLKFGGLFSQSKWIIKKAINSTISDFDSDFNVNPRRAKIEIELAQYVPIEIKRSSYVSGNF
jgi:hypothetical protein